MATLTIRNVRKSFGALEVLKGINLEADDGEFIALVGPSGCGKSTLLAMIAGLDSITAGEIRIGGRKVNSVPPKDRDIAMVFQSYALYPTMTVRENITFGMESRRVPKPEQDAAVKRVAALPADRAAAQAASPASSPAASASASPWAGRWCATPASFSSTSRSPTSTPSCASTCAPRSRSCTSASARPRSTSPTTRSRR